MTDEKQQDDDAPPEPSTRLVEGVDYYVDEGRWVFTAGFLRRRGTCCNSGCRHCPYRNDAVEAAPR